MMFDELKQRIDALERLVSLMIQTQEHHEEAQRSRLSDIEERLCRMEQEDTKHWEKGML